jgi:branched-chain amino acid transport system substrate-binding protein
LIRALAAIAVCLAFAGVSRAEIPGNVVRVGVLTDMAGPFADQVGPGSVVAARLAAEDFATEESGLQVEILSADHQNKPDIGTAIARHWVDVDGIGAVVDVPNSAVALGVSGIMRERHRVALASSAATSSPLVPQSLGAKALALANTGADAINAVKQAGEFGLRRLMEIAALFMQISDIQAIGLESAQGLLLTEAFYWDLSDQIRAFSGGSPLAWEDGCRPWTNSACIRRPSPICERFARCAPWRVAEPLFGPVRVRGDGRAIHAMYVFQVKKPAESGGPWDLYRLVQTIPGDQAFRALAEGGCPLVR